MLLVFVGSRLSSQMFLTAVLQSSNPVSPSSSSVSPFNSMKFRSLFALNSELAFTTLIIWWYYCFCSLGPVFHAHSSYHQKNGLLQSSVPRFLRPLPSATCVIVSTSMGLYLISAEATAATFTNKSSTYKFPSFLTTDLSFFFEQVVPSLDGVGRAPSRPRPLNSSSVPWESSPPDTCSSPSSSAK